MAYALAIASFSSVILFLAIWLGMNLFYLRATSKWPVIYRIVEKIRLKSNSRMVRKYGIFGLALLMAVPLPTLGVYSGTVLSWMMGMKWWSSMIAVVSGTAVSNSLVLLSVFGIAKATVFFG